MKIFKSWITMGRLLIITHHFPPEANGTATRVHELVKRMLRLAPDIRIYVVAPPPSRPFGKFKRTYKIIRKEELYNGRAIIFRVWSFQPSSSNPPSIQRVMNYLIFTLLSIPIVLVLSILSKLVIVVTPPSSTCLAGVLAKIFNKSLIVDITDLWHEEATLLGYVKGSSLMVRLSRAVEVLTLKKAKMITVATYTIGKYYSHVLRKKKFYVLPTPIDTSLASLCRKNKVNEDIRTIVYAGNFGKPQALHLAIKAFALLSKYTNFNIRLILVGGGETEEHLRKLIKELGINNVVILSPISRGMLFRKYYTNAAAGLVPLAFSQALIYAIPTKVYEYIACGLPFISYGGSLELKRLVLLSKAGIHVDIEDPSMIAKAVLHILRNRYEYAKRVQNFAKVLEEHVEAVLREIVSYAEG